MTQTKAIPIKNWLKNMGFKLSKSHLVERRTRKIKYYTLGTFGIYEETSAGKSSEAVFARKHKFISWTPWGDDFEINSVKDLSRAYQDFMNYNPNVVLN